MTLTEQITKAVRRYLSGTNNMVLYNTFVHPSPWECDVLAISDSYFMTEYEIKVSVSDYRADFRKEAYLKAKHWGSINKVRKHDYYQHGPPYELDEKWTPPIPRRFFFVFPEGMIDPSEVPPLYGVMVYGWKCGEYKRDDVKVVRNPQVIKGHTKLDIGHIFALANKSIYCDPAEISLDSERDWQIDL